MSAGVPFTNIFTFIAAGKSNYFYYKVWDEIITYPFPNFKGAAVEVWEWISNHIPHFTGATIIDR